MDIEKSEYSKEDDLYNNFEDDLFNENDKDIFATLTNTNTDADYEKKNKDTFNDWKNDSEKKQKDDNVMNLFSFDENIEDFDDLDKKDNTLKKILDLIGGDYSPIIPDVVTDYYLMKNGFETSNVKIKRLIALATQKFILDIAQDAYEYSRIRNQTTVYNSSNPHLKAKQLVQGHQFSQQSSGSGLSLNPESVDQQPSSYSNNYMSNQKSKIVLTMEDLSNALSEYGLNISKPDFYR